MDLLDGHTSDTLTYVPPLTLQQNSLIGAAGLHLDTLRIQ